VQKILPKIEELSFPNGLANSLDQLDIKIKIMYGIENTGQNFSAYEQVPQVSPAEIPTGIALAP